MLGDDKDIRSSLTVNHVLGQVDTDGLSKTLQDRCGAAPLRVDASSKDRSTRRLERSWKLTIYCLAAGSFPISEDMKPRVINLDFPALPAGAEKSQRLVENGTLLSIASLIDE